MSNMTPCIDCDRNPQNNILEGFLSLNGLLVDNSNRDKYHRDQSITMKELKEYKDVVAVYNEFKHKIYNYFFYRTSLNKELAEDLTSDTFLKVYEKFDSYDSTYAMSTWLYTIARNVLIDHSRSKNAKYTEEISDIHEDETALEFLELIDQEIDISRIEEALDELPNKQKEMIQKKYFQYKDISEIAEDESMQESAVRKNLSRGIKRLQEILVVMLIFINIV